tara:strand:- start:1 stop:171 length:171 start_codon:yes stop_codon:yes gene_type:complete
MDYVIPVPDYQSNGDEVVEVILPQWMIRMIDRDRKGYGQTRSEFLFDLIMDGIKED